MGWKATNRLSVPIEFEAVTPICYSTFATEGKETSLVRSFSWCQLGHRKSYHHSKTQAFEASAKSCGFLLHSLNLGRYLLHT